MAKPEPDADRDFKRLFQYNQWATRRLLTVMEESPDLPDRALELLSHLLRTQDVWYGRVEQTHHAELDFWAVDSLSTCAKRLDRSTRRWTRLVDSTRKTEEQQTVHYANSKGTTFDTPLKDILTHVLNHGTHHRAQAALVLRNAEIAPPATDFIFYVRED